MPYTFLDPLQSRALQSVLYRLQYSVAGFIICLALSRAGSQHPNPSHVQQRSATHALGQLSLSCQPRPLSPKREKRTSSPHSTRYPSSAYSEPVFLLAALYATSGKLRFRYHGTMGCNRLPTGKTRSHDGCSTLDSQTGTHHFYQTRNHLVSPRGHSFGHNDGSRFVAVVHVHVHEDWPKEGKRNHRRPKQSSRVVERCACAVTSFSN